MLYNDRIILVFLLYNENKLKIYVDYSYIICNNSLRSKKERGYTIMKRTDIENKTTLEIMEFMEENNIDGDQDWDNETTVYELDDCEVVVCCNDVVIVNK